MFLKRKISRPKMAANKFEISTSSNGYFLLYLKAPVTYIVLLRANGPDLKGKSK